MRNKPIKFVALLLIVFVSCNSNSDEHGYNNIASIEPLAYTIYSDKTELFVEFQPLIAGLNSKFAAHFTVLGDSFHALSEGQITVSLIVEDKGIKNTAEKPGSPGIYRLALTPVLAGTGKLIFDIQTPNYTDRIIIEDIIVFAEEQSAIASQKKEINGGDITYLKEQAWKVAFANTSVKKQPFNDIIKTSGQIIAAPGDEMIVTAKASGIVLFSGNSTIIGSEVGSGANLFTITGGDIAEGNIDANYKEIKANYEKTKADYERAKELVQDRIVSEKDFLNIKLKYDQAQTAFNTISKNYTLGGQIVSSPINGFVKNIFVSEGQFVEAGAPLATISKNKKLLLQANISQKYFDKLSSITAANFKLTGKEYIYSTGELNGKIISYGKSATANSPFLPITFEIDNTGNLVPGSVAELYLKSAPIPDALVIPVSALIEEQGFFFVYVQTAGESFQKREVELGAGDGVQVQVISGIEAGERVVTKGAYQIKLSAASGALPDHGHEH